MLIPKHIRDKLGIAPRSTVVIEYDAKRNRAIITAGEDIVDRAGMVAPRKGKWVLAARDAYETSYKRT